VEASIILFIVVLPRKSIAISVSSMKCGGRRENVCLQIGQYHLKSHMFAIDMGDFDIALGVEWLCTLGPILMDFKELTMPFQ
jgi:hypothetical protein